MSFGFSFVNDSGEYLVNQDTVTPMLFTKVNFGSAVATYFTVEGYTGYQHAVTGYSYGTPTGDYLTFMTLPSSASVVYFNFDGSAMNVFCAAGTSYTLPEVYIFSLTNHATPSGTHGIKVWKADGTTVAFDSRIRPLAITSMPGTTTVNNSTETSLALGTLPTKPAFMVPYYAQEIWTRQGLTSTSDVAEYMGGYRRNGSTLFLKGIGYQTEALGFGVSTTYTYGQTTGLSFPIIDAALYD